MTALSRQSETFRHSHVVEGPPSTPFAAVARKHGVRANGLAARCPVGRWSRRGGTYLIVLSAAMLVAVTGLAGITAVRIQGRGTRTALDFAEARLYAQAGIDRALHAAQRTLGWRTLLGSGRWFNRAPIGGGDFTVDVIDPEDGDLDDSDTDPVQITATGTKGNARCILRTLLKAEERPLEILQTAIHTAGELRVNFTRQLKVTYGPASSNGTISNSGTIQGDAQALAIVNLGTITGSSTILALPKAMPDAGVFAAYQAIATRVTAAGTFERAVLTPTYSPLGPVNADGVYFIDAGASDVTLRGVRVHGTLLVKCRQCVVDSDVLIQNYRSDYPALIVDGDAVVRFTGSDSGLAESAWTNFNPPGAPYNSQTDTDTSDPYPCEIKGLVHVTGTLQFDGNSRIRGAVICESAAVLGAVTVNASPEIIYNPALYSSPPWKYTQLSPNMRISWGTFEQRVDP